MQTEDDSLRGLRNMIAEVKVRNRREVTFEKKKGYCTESSNIQASIEESFFGNSQSLNLCWNK